MKKVITLDLLQQDVLLLENEVNITSEIDFFLSKEEAESAAKELTGLPVAFRQWNTKHGVKNLLVINGKRELAMISRVVVLAAFDILRQREVESEEMVGLLVQLLMERIYEKD